MKSIHLHLKDPPLQGKNWLKEKGKGLLIKPSLNAQPACYVKYWKLTQGIKNALIFFYLYLW